MEFKTGRSNIRILILILFSWRFLFGQSTPVVQPLHISPTEQQIVIDGIINDPGWSQAAIVDKFYEVDPGDLTPPEVKTKVFITYDQQNLYVAFECFDNPADLRASLRDRDQIWEDDYVGVLIDTYSDANTAYYVFSNPLGIQADTRFSIRSGEDDNFDLIYKSNAQINDHGFSVEMAIPFSSLRFPDNVEQKWRINFWRNRPRDSRYRYSWVPLDRDNSCHACQFAPFTGIRNVESGNPVQVIPAVVASRSGYLRENSAGKEEFVYSDFQGEASLSLKWPLSPSTSVEATVNPDFSQVESDAAQIDVNTTFALSYQEKRPFFQEGADLFQTWNDVVYTRSINDPLFAVKMLSTSGRNTFALLSAWDENTPLILPFEEKSEFVALSKSFSNIFRYTRTLGNNSYIGLMGTDRRYQQEGNNSVIGVDGIYYFDKNNQVELQLLLSQTVELNDTTLSSGFNNELFNKNKHTAALDGESFYGSASYFSIEHSSRHWQYDLDYGHSSPTFRAENGFISHNNNRQLILHNAFIFYETHSLVDKIFTFVNTGKVWNYRSTVKDQWIMTGLNFSFKGQNTLEVNYLFNTERFNRIVFSDINRLNIYFTSKFSDLVSFGFRTQTGRSIARRVLQKGQSLYVEFWSTIKPVPQFIIQPEVTYSNMRSIKDNHLIYDGYIFRTRANYQFSREMFLRLIVQYNKFSEQISFEPLLSYKFNPFSIFYIGISQMSQNETGLYDWNLSSRQYFTKFQYLFNI